MRVRLLLFALIVVACPAIANAQFYVGPQVSIMGLGGSAAYRINNLVSIDGSFGYMPYKNFSLTLKGNEYDFENDIRGGFLGISLHPTGGSLAISGGILWGGWAAEGELLGGEVVLNGRTYSAGEIGTLLASTEVEGPTPAFWVGSRGRAFNWGLGLALIDEVIADLSANGPIASDPTFIADLEAAEQEIIDQIDYGVFPMFRIGWQFRLGDR